MTSLDSLVNTTPVIDPAILKVTGGMIPRDLYCFFWPELCGPFWP